jgi:hypothetical protein
MLVNHHITVVLRLELGWPVKVLHFRCKRRAYRVRR